MNPKVNGKPLARKVVAAALALSLLGSLAPQVVIGAAIAAPATAYTLTAKAGPGGSIDPSGTFTAVAGSKVKFVAKPDPGYALDSVVIDGKAKKNPDVNFNIGNIQGNHDVSVTFKKVAPAAKEYTISASSSAGGSISPSGSVRVKEGDSARFDVSPEKGYEIDYVLINDSKVPTQSSYTFSNVTANQTIKAVFVKTAAKSFTITASAGTGGTISPSGNFGVSKGDSASFTITPDSGYKILDVRVDGGSVGAVTSYKFTKVKENHDIKATFQKKAAAVDLRITSALAKNITNDSATLVVKVAGSSKYTLYWETQGSSGYKQVNESKNKASYKLTGLQPGTTYNVRCVVTDNSGSQVVSSTITFTTTGKKAGGGTDTPKGDYPCNGIIKGGSVNVRSEASTSAKSITTFHKGDKVTVLGYVSSKSFVPGFYKIKWGSGVAYIAANYIDLVK